jgi:hypothetical protein
MPFHLVNERHHYHRPMIFTTNKSLKSWGRVLHDDDLGLAIIDRVLERGRLLRLDGPSIRTLHANLDGVMKDQSDQGSDLVRTFPEPTAADVDQQPLQDVGVSAEVHATHPSSFIKMRTPALEPLTTKPQQTSAARAAAPTPIAIHRVTHRRVLFPVRRPRSGSKM